MGYVHVLKHKLIVNARGPKDLRNDHLFIYTPAYFSVKKNISAEYELSNFDVHKNWLDP